MLYVVQCVVTRHLLDSAHLKADEDHYAVIMLIQHFGSSANLNIHQHGLVLDEIYRCGAVGVPTHIEAGGPTDCEMHLLLQAAIAGLLKMLTRRGVLFEYMGRTYLAKTDADSEQARCGRCGRWLPFSASPSTRRPGRGC